MAHGGPLGLFTKAKFAGSSVDAIRECCGKIQLLSEVKYPVFLKCGYCGYVGITYREVVGR